MRGNESHRGSAVGARFAGLGIATAVAFAMGAVPATALAAEGEGPDVAAVTATEDEETPSPQEGTNANGLTPGNEENSAGEQVKSDASDSSQKSDDSSSLTSAGETKPVASSEDEGKAADASPKAAIDDPSKAGGSSNASDSAQGTAEAPGSAETSAGSKAADAQQVATWTETLVTPTETPATPPAAQAQSVAAPAAQPVASVTVSAPAAAEPTPTYTNVYRLYNPNSGEHFYTTNLDEATTVFSKGWHWEEAAYLESSRGDKAVYRLYNPNAGAHFYTIDEGESNYLRSLGWIYENIAFYASGSNLLFRLYNPNSPIGEHLYTAEAAESDYLRSIGWVYEGYAWAFTPGRHSIAGQWVVSPAYGSEERYWVSSDTTLAKNRYVETSEGSGWRAYAKSSGAVVRGFFQVDGTRGLVADNNGALETGDGMVVTGRYTNGAAQRYFLSNGYLRLGEFSYGGNNYFGRYDTGYLVRGDYFDPNAGKMYRGNDAGVLQARNTARDRYVDWALAIAKDNSHGYSQINRWGPNYDCSSMVISALRQAGYGTGGASYTGNMYSELSRYGWYSVAPNAGNLRYGDILLNDTHHTAIYLANGWLVQASSDENGSWEGYRSGDQTGREIWYRSYYNYPWTRFLRHS